MRLVPLHNSYLRPTSATQVPEGTVRRDEAVSVPKVAAVQPHMEFVACNTHDNWPQATTCIGQQRCGPKGDMLILIALFSSGNVLIWTIFSKITTFTKHIDVWGDPDSSERSITRILISSTDIIQTRTITTTISPFAWYQAIFLPVFLAPVLDSLFPVPSGLSQ